MTSELDKSIKAHYREKCLPEASLDRIITLGDKAREKPSGARNARFWHTSQWQVASMVFVVAIVTGIFIGQHQLITGNVTDLVLQEIAMNHNKRLSVEYPLKEYSQLNQKMVRLDFTLIRPDTLPSHYKLIGGRYCSIQGHIAAQLKIKNTRDGKIDTLYVTPMTERLTKINPQMEARQGNVDIKLWQANDMLYGLATDH